jgi:glycosyltransferase involved in cell wall biosynthesis
VTGGPLVSIIIPTKNSQRTIRDCLTAINKQSYGNKEVLVVDNFSSDLTAVVARDCGAKVLLGGPERSAQFNLGAKNAKGKYLYRLDSDMLAGPEVVAEAVNACERFMLDGVIIRLLSDPSVSFWSTVRSFERMDMYQYDTNVALRFISKRAFEKIGGFDASLSGFEDYDLHDRFVKAGFHYGRISAQEVHVGEPKTLAEVARKHFYYGKFLRPYLSKDASRVRRLTMLRRGQKSRMISLMSSPRLFFGFVVYQSVRYLSALMGMLTSL